SGRCTPGNRAWPRNTAPVRSQSGNASGRWSLWRGVTRTGLISPSGRAASRMGSGGGAVSGPGASTAPAACADSKEGLVPLSVIGPGSGATTRWITRSEYWQLDRLADDVHGNLHRPPVGAGPAVAATRDVPRPAVPRTGQLGAAQRAARERAA